MTALYVVNFLFGTVQVHGIVTKQKLNKRTYEYNFFHGEKYE